VHVADDLAALRALIPEQWPQQMHEDMLHNMWEALFTGRVTMEALHAPGGVRPFIRQVYRENFEQSGFARSFDDVAFAITESQREAA